MILLMLLSVFLPHFVMKYLKTRAAKHDDSSEFKKRPCEQPLRPPNIHIPERRKDLSESQTDHDERRLNQAYMPFISYLVTKS